MTKVLVAIVLWPLNNAVELTKQYGVALQSNPEMQERKQ